MEQAHPKRNRDCPRRGGWVQHQTNSRRSRDQSQNRTEPPAKDHLEIVLREYHQRGRPDDKGRVYIGEINHFHKERLCIYLISKVITLIYGSAKK
jgi:hypothetical protein